MSQENVERVRQALDAFNRRDRATWLAMCDADYEAVPSDDWPETAAVRGREAVWDYFIRTDEAWDQATYEVVELLDAADDKVVTHWRQEMHGRASGVGVMYDYWVVFA